MHPRTLSPKLPKGLAFDIPDHIKASQWATQHGVPLVIDLDFGGGNEDYEEVLEFYVAAPTRRLWCVVWRQVDGVVVQPLVGRPRRYVSLTEALAALARRRRWRTAS